MAPRLRPEESVLGAVFESAPLGIIAVDSNGNIQLANRMAEQLYGYSSTELVGQPMAMLVPEPRRDAYRTLLAQLFARSDSGPMGPGVDVTGLRRNGAEFPIEIGCSRSGRLMVYFVSDRSERKQLQEERDRFFELSPDFLCIVARDGAFRQVNPAFQRKLGWTVEELTSAPFGAFIHPEDFEATRELKDRIQATGEELTNFENRYMCKDGSFRWFQWTGPATKPGDTVYYAAARDITEAKQLEEERDRLIALIENSPDYIGLATPDGSGHLYVNQAGRDLLGLPELDQLRQMSVPHIVTKHNARALMVPGEALNKEGRWQGEGIFYHLSTGDPIPMDVNTFMIFDRLSGRPLAWAVVARDIRERKHTEERLQALTGQLFRVLGEERSRIARDLHDDITQKIVALGMDLGMIFKDLERGALSEELASLHERILALSEDVRTLAYQHHPAVLLHSGLVDALREHCREVSRQAAIRVDFSAHEVPSPLPPEISVTLYRIAQEALRNIMKHSGATAASVILSCRLCNGGKQHLKLSVIDNGCGFATAEVKKGAGLGLLSIEERARLANGRVAISSVLGEGSRVEIEIPL